MRKSKKTPRRTLFPKEITVRRIKSDGDYLVVDDEGASDDGDVIGVYTLTALRTVRVTRTLE